MTVKKIKPSKHPLFINWLCSICNRASKKERRLQAAKVLIDKELDLQKFMQRMRLVLNATLVLLTPEQE